MRHWVTMSPFALVTGDQVTIAETEAILPGIETVVVKHAATRFAAMNLHPVAACRAIRDGARRAARRVATGDVRAAPSYAAGASQIDWLSADMAEMAAWINGIERAGERVVVIEGDEPLQIYRHFVAAIAITRSIVET